MENNISSAKSPLEEYVKEKTLLRAAQTGLQQKVGEDFSALEIIAGQRREIEISIPALQNAIEQMKQQQKEYGIFMREARVVSRSFDGTDPILSGRALSVSRNYEESLEQLKPELAALASQLVTENQERKTLTAALQERIFLFKDLVQTVMGNQRTLPQAYCGELQRIAEGFDCEMALQHACLRFRNLLYCTLRPRRTPRPAHVKPVVREHRESMRVQIRWMIRRDMPEVLFTEQLSFEHPWSEENFLRHIRQRNCIGMVAEAHDKVVGFMIYELHKNKLHILNFAVHPLYRKRGIGDQMTEKLISKLSSHRRTRITVDVGERNLPAQVFFRASGFMATGIRQAVCEDSSEDALPDNDQSELLMEYTSRKNNDAGEQEYLYYVEEMNQADESGQGPDGHEVDEDK